MQKTIILAVIACVVLAAPCGADDLTEQEKKALELAQAMESQMIGLVKRIRPAYVMIGGGSGVLISPDGLMLTNNHVAGRAKVWQVILPNLKRYKANVLGTDSRGDLCLLKLEKAKNLPYLELGDSDKLRPGQRVIAIGNPWMAGRLDGQPTVSMGVVSAINIFRGNYTDAIQTDAPINPGNSGGPLITMEGKLVGINGQVAVRFGTDRVNTGIGYAIPSNQIKAFMKKMKAAEGKNVSHGVLSGVGIAPSYHDGHGARVMTVSESSPAFKAGLRKGDTIMEVDGRRVTSRYRLSGILGTVPAGTELTLKVKRAKTEKLIKVPLTARRSIRPTQPRNPNAPFLGIQFNQSYGGPGVQIEVVIPGSSAEKADLKADDIILTFDGKKVTNPQNLIQLIGRKKVGDKIKLKVKRGLDTLDITVELGRRGNNSDKYSN